MPLQPQSRVFTVFYSVTGLVIFGVIAFLAAAYSLCRWFAPLVLRPVLQYVDERFRRAKAVYQASQNKLDIVVYGAR